MTSYYIYKITCTAGSLKDHYYIGQRKCYCLPEKDKYKGSGRQIKDYYKKYPNNYKKEILCFCADEDDLNQKEDFYVGDLYETDQLCLNLCKGGNHYATFKGKHHTDESRNKMSEAKKNISEDSRKKMSEAKKHISEETRRKLSEAKKGENNPAKRQEVRKKISDAVKNRPEETRKKISESLKGMTFSDEHRKKLSEARHGGKWMNNGLQQKYIKPDEVNLYLDIGYSLGRLKK